MDITDFDFVELQGSDGIIYVQIYVDKGEYSIIYKGCYKNEEVAIKILKNCREKDIRRNYEEIEKLKALKHQNVISFIENVETTQNMFIIMEYCDGGSLNKLLKRKTIFEEHVIKHFMKQIIDGLAYIHSQNIIHRDMKPANVLIADNTLKIADFGLSIEEWKVIDGGEIVGTPNYAAPEMLRRLKYSFGVDVWALGVMIYYFKTGKPSFQTSCAKDTFKKIKNAEYSPILDASDELSDLLSQIFVLDMTKRISLENILAHPFMKF